ncbi:MAG: phosphatidylserine decarboxylase family protein [Verrucomicrobia bacterium]|nr:phosphatidylserine decarboxylase family protein [Verrucomicrobiota bacterium]
MKRNFQPSPMKFAMPVLRWLFVLMVIGAVGRWWLLFWPCLALFVFHAAFHRNPKRRHPDDPLILVAPADGRVTDVSEVEEPKFIKGKAVRVGIFLSVFDVHTQPAPCDATLKSVDYQPGRFFDARDPRCSPQNESQALGLETPDGTRLVVKQIAGVIARRIILWRLVDEDVKRGELLGMIRYGSRVELYLPQGFAEVMVGVGDRVKGGKTAIARKNLSSRK